MKRLSSVLLVPGAVLLLSLQACQEGADQACDSGALCGTAVMISVGEPPTLFPPHAQADHHLAIDDLMFWRLADLATGAPTVGDSGYIPRLARDWTREDSLTIAFTMHPDARWHDGRPVTAEDVAFTIDLHNDPVVNYPGRSRLARISSVTARDSMTAVFRFTQPYPEQLFDAVFHVRILPKHILDTVPRGDLQTHAFGQQPIGNGPYRFTRWQRGEFIELAGDASFYAGRPGLEQIIWRYVDDRSAVVTALVGGDADFTNSVPGLQAVERISKDPELRVKPVLSASHAFVLLNLRDPHNPERPHPLFGNRDVRRALVMATSAQSLIDAILGDLAAIPVGPVTQPVWVWSDDVARITYEPGRARQLLAEMGWQDTDGDDYLDRGGEKLAFELIVPGSSAGRAQSAVLLQDQMKQLGVDMTVTELDYNTWNSRTTNGDFDATYHARIQDPSPAGVAELWVTDGSQNRNGYSNPTVDALVDEAIATFDRVVAKEKWKAVVNQINADAPAIWIYAPKMLPGMHVRLQNTSFDPFEWWRSIWTWSVTTASP